MIMISDLFFKNYFLKIEKNLFFFRFFFATIRFYVFLYLRKNSKCNEKNEDFSVLSENNLKINRSDLSLNYFQPIKLEIV